MRDAVKRWYLVGLSLLGALVSLAVYPRLPQSMATHWDIDGSPNGWMSRSVAAFLLPGVILVCGVVLRALPIIDPRRKNFAKFENSYEFVIGSVLVFLLLLHFCILAAALGHNVPIQRAAPLLTGALFIAIGSQLPHSRSNFWYGIRTPWTLSSDRVWTRTHRIAGYTMTIGGLLMIIGGAILPTAAGIALVVAASVAATIGPAVYSYFIWRQEPPQ